MAAIIHVKNVKHVPDQSAHPHSSAGSSQEGHGGRHGGRREGPRCHGMSHVLSWGSQLSGKLYQSMNISVKACYFPTERTALNGTDMDPSCKLTVLFWAVTPVTVPMTVKGSTAALAPAAPPVTTTL